MRLGRLQLEIIKCVEPGPISMSALHLRLGANSQPRRDQVYASLARLEAGGLVRVTGRRGKQNKAGVMVEKRAEGGSD
jgi:hypothetical protein